MGESGCYLPLGRDEGQQDMIVDTSPKRGTKEEGKQVKFGKQFYGTLFLMEMHLQILTGKLEREVIIVG